MPDFGGLFRKGFEREVNLVQTVERPVTLIVMGGMSAVKITGSMDGKVMVKGKTSIGGRVSLRVEEREKLGLTALIDARKAGIEVSAPIRALVLRLSSSAINVGGVEVEYITCNISYSSIKIIASLENGGGFLGKLAYSTIKAELNPSVEGEYWIDLDLSMSTAKIITPPNTAYIVEGTVPANVKIPREKLSKEAPIVFKLRINASSSSIMLS